MGKTLTRPIRSGILDLYPPCHEIVKYKEQKNLTIKKGGGLVPLKSNLDAIPANYNTLARFNDLNNQTAEIGLVTDTLPTLRQ